MASSDLSSIALCLLLLVAGMGLYLSVFVHRWHITHLNRSWITIVYFLCLSGLVVLLFFDAFSTLTTKVTVAPVGLLAGLIILSPFTYWLIRRLNVRPTAFLELHPSQNFLQLEYRYVIAKGAEILFQQVCVIVLVVLLAARGIPLANLTVLFAALFGVLHLGLFFTGDRRWALYYTLFSILGGLIFPVLILRVESGFIYGFVLHWFFYMLAGAVFWVWHQPKRSPQGV